MLSGSNSFPSSASLGKSNLKKNILRKHIKYAVCFIFVFIVFAKCFILSTVLIFGHLMKKNFLKHVVYEKAVKCINFCEHFVLLMKFRSIIS